MQSNLAKRIEKAGQLRFTPIKDSDEWNTWGSNDDHYVTYLFYGKVKIYTPQERLVTSFYTSCNKHTVGRDYPYTVDIQCCQGNDQHTVCYHSVGKIIHAYKDTGKEVQFFDYYNEANAMVSCERGDKLVKIFNSNKKGHIWAVISKKRQFDFLEAKEIIDTMRGKEDDEGID